MKKLFPFFLLEEGFKREGEWEGGGPIKLHKIPDNMINIGAKAVTGSSNSLVVAISYYMPDIVLSVSQTLKPIHPISSPLF